METDAHGPLAGREAMTFIDGVARAISAARPLEDVLRTILEGLQQTVLCDRVALALIDGDAAVEKAIVTVGSDDEAFRTQAWTLDDRESPWWRELSEQRIAKIIDPSEDAGYAGRAVSAVYPAPFVKVPIVVREAVVGTITADNCSTRRPISTDDLPPMQAFAALAAVAIESSRLSSEILRSKEEVLQAQKHLVETERLAALGAMAASINHEINNPLCAIVLDVQLITMTLAPDQEKLRKRVESIENSVKRIRAVTEKVAALKRTIVTEYQPKTDMLDLNLSTK